MTMSKHLAAIVATVVGAAAVSPSVAAADVELRRDGSKAVPVQVPPPTTPSPADGFDWGDAGAGAGAGLLAVSAGGAVVFLTRRRRRGSVTSSPAVSAARTPEPLR
jgi:hypothetical protein